MQDVRLVRRAGALVDRTHAEEPDREGELAGDQEATWSASSTSTASRSRTAAAPACRASCSTRRRRPSTRTTRTPTSRCTACGRSATTTRSARTCSCRPSTRYYNTGFILDPTGGLEHAGGPQLRRRRSRTARCSQGLNVRPQKVVNVDAHSFVERDGRQPRHQVRLRLPHDRRDVEHDLAGQRHSRQRDAPATCSAQVFREGYGGNRANYLNFYVGDTIAADRVTVDLGLRYDQQDGEALPSEIAANPAFPNVVPGVDVRRLRDAVHVEQLLAARRRHVSRSTTTRKTIARASFSRYAGQLNTGTVGVLNPSSTAGSATYRWVDTNGDHFAQAERGATSTSSSRAAGGFNPANPTAVTSANVLDPDLKAPRTTSIVARRRSRADDRTSRCTVNYSYTRTTGSVRQLQRHDHAARRRDAGRLRAGHAASPARCRTARTYNVPTSIPNAGARSTAGGNGFVTTNVPGYSTDYHGLEVGLIKRLSNRWMGRVGFSWNNAARALRRRRRDVRHQRQPDADGRPSRSRTAASSRRRAAAAGRAPSTSTPSGSSTPTRCTRRRTGIEVSAQRVRPAGLSVPDRPLGHGGGARRRLGAQRAGSPEIDYVPLRRTCGTPTCAWRAQFKLERGERPRRSSTCST